jgi:hypothetical protein
VPTSPPPVVNGAAIAATGPVVQAEPSLAPGDIIEVVFVSRAGTIIGEDCDGHGWVITRR